ncbi:hypothetical protein E2C01_090733 [Portunus trituberculatus]|uniref:Uncharacterized protein n=1 Tax=Portunus trituberculatus TaxID=210409 RepID=A0A5B7JQW9_PORTR|nr:hypothetical protein [Portunus trituberculatus]
MNTKCNYRAEVIHPRVQTAHSLNVGVKLREGWGERLRVRLGEGFGHPEGRLREVGEGTSVNSLLWPGQGMFRVDCCGAFVIVSGRVYVSPSLPLQAGYKRIVFAWHSKPMLAVCHAAPGQCDNRTTQAMS